MNAAIMLAAALGSVMLLAACFYWAQVERRGRALRRRHRRRMTALAEDRPDRDRAARA